MASITNRSAFTVTVPGYRGKDKNKYTRAFAHSKLKDAEAYMRALIEQGFTPDIAPAEDTSQVKVIRSTGPGGALQLQSKFRKLRNTIWQRIGSLSVSDLPKF